MVGAQARRNNSEGIPQLSGLVTSLIRALLGFNTPIGGAFSPDMYLCCDLLCIQNKESFPWNYLTFIINLMVTVRKTRSLFNLKEIYKNFDFFPQIQTVFRAYFKMFMCLSANCICVFVYEE